VGGVAATTTTLGTEPRLMTDEQDPLAGAPGYITRLAGILACGDVLVEVTLAMATFGTPPQPPGAPNGSPKPRVGGECD
jgi:hypothetical protein